MNSNYKFTETWFDGSIPLWTTLFKEYTEQTGDINNVLEIGCYEGRATTWLCDNVLTDLNQTYNYDVIDTFGGSLNESGMVNAKSLLGEDDDIIEKTFKHNISFHKHVNFTIHKGSSQKVLPTFNLEPRYDFIYIDASHRADDTFVDAYYASKMLKINGLLIFDDYGWKDPKNLHPSNSPELGVNVFDIMYNQEFMQIFKGYQVGYIKKA